MKRRGRGAPSNSNYEGKPAKKMKGLSPQGCTELCFPPGIKKSQGYQVRWQGEPRVPLRAISPQKTQRVCRVFFLSWKPSKEGDKEALSSGSAIPSLLEGAGGLMQPGISPFQFSPQTQRQKNARNFPAPSPDLLPSPFPPLAISSSGLEGGILITK